MAAKATKTRNPDRRSGKAWGKDHNAAPKVLTEATKEHRAKSAAERAKVVRHEKGSYITWPEVDWNWFENIMTSRWPNTRRVRTIDACISQGRTRPKETDGMPVAVTDNSEPKLSGARPSKKSLSKANAAARRDGRR